MIIRSYRETNLYYETNYKNSYSIWYGYDMIAIPLDYNISMKNSLMNKISNYEPRSF